MEDSFYKNGLSFECQACSNCCRKDPGYVFLSEKDLLKLTNALSLNRNEFLSKYCRTINIGGFKRISLIEKENYDCIFWENGGCIIYEARPLQCRSYPFWTPFLASREDWDALADSCPGINRGRIHSRKEIERWISMRFEDPHLEPEC